MPTDTNRAGKVLRVLVAIGVVSTVVWETWFQKEPFGYAAYDKNTVQYAAAGTTPLALISCVLGIVFFCVLMRTELRVGDFTVAPLWRRYAAFLIDLWFFLFIFANVTAMIPLLFEAGRTKLFQWHFERDYLVPSDWAMGALILMCFGTMLAYFVLPLANRRQTVGFWILRIATVSSDGSVLSLPLSIAIRRIYMDFTELFSPFSLWRIARGRDARPRTLSDRETGLMVVHYQATL